MFSFQRLGNLYLASFFPFDNRHLLQAAMTTDNYFTFGFNVDSSAQSPLHIGLAVGPFTFSIEFYSLSYHITP